MATTLDLAGALRALDADALEAGLRRRQLRASGVRDVFDLADALLEASSVRDALAHLDRAHLLVLQAVREPRDAAGVVAALPAAPALSGALDEARVRDVVADLAALLLVVVGEDGTASCPTAVGDRLDDDPALAVGALASTPPPAADPSDDDPSDDDAAAADPSDDADDAPAGSPVDADRGAEQRLAEVVVQAAELLRALDDAPARELAKGGLAQPERRRLAEASRLPVDDVPALLDVLVAADLVASGPDGWSTTDDASGWLVAAWPDRWTRLVGAWLDALPPGVAGLLRTAPRASWGASLRAHARWTWPAGGAWTDDALVAVAGTARLLALTTDDVPTSVAGALLDEGPEAARDRVAALLPDPVETVYLQHDLSVVAPGPLRPDLEERLRTVAVAESTGLAATYRVTEDRVRGALTRGEDATSLLAFLDDLSTTGVPQPLEYLLRRTAEDHGRYRVGPPPAPRDADTAEDRLDRAVVTVRDVVGADALEADRAVTALGLHRRDVTTLGSRAAPEAVHHALLQERYAVVLVDADDLEVAAPVAPGPRRRGASAPAPAPRRDPVAELVERLRTTAGDPDESTDRAWIARQLDVAVKGRLTVTVTVDRPDGSTATLELEPTGLGGGRLRGRERGRDVERTLPLASVTSVTGA